MWLDKARAVLRATEIPEGESGDWKIEKFTVSDHDAKFFNLRCDLNFQHHRRIEPGTYTRLWNKKALVMSDTPAEVRDQLMFTSTAQGVVLVNGLGLAVTTRLLLAKPDVTRVIVNEISQDVINLVLKYIKNDKLTVNHANAFEWKPPKGFRFDAVWHDIWNDICADNLPDMRKLHRRYGHWADTQGSWGRDQINRRW